MPDWLASRLIGAAFIVVAGYDALYIAHYLGIVKLPVLLGMAAFPPLMFLLVAIARGNVAAVCTSVRFGAIHIGLTYSSFRTMTAS